MDVNSYMSYDILQIFRTVLHNDRITMVTFVFSWSRSRLSRCGSLISTFMDIYLRKVDSGSILGIRVDRLQ